MTTVVRRPTDLYKAGGRIKKGSFQGLWHFSFDQYQNHSNINFGTLRVYNDDIISKGGEWGIHPHKRNEVLTYVVKGEFLHEDENGHGGIMTVGDMQHTTVGTGMWHNEINNKENEEMRFIQMWFLPRKEVLPPSVTQVSVDREDRKNKLLLLASNEKKAPLIIQSHVNAYTGFLENGNMVNFTSQEGWGVYLGALKGGDLKVNKKVIPERGAAKISGESDIQIQSKGNVELLLLEVSLTAPYISKYV